MAHPLTFLQAQQQHAVIIDTRDSASFNGWPAEMDGTIGHETGALHLAGDWLSLMDHGALQAWISAHALTPDTVIALYGDESERVRQRLMQVGLKADYTLSDALTIPSRLMFLPGFQQWVYPQWLCRLLQGKAVYAKPTAGWRIIEVVTGDTAVKAHIPGATCLNINHLESPPLWNVVPASTLSSVLEAQGLRVDTTVILYGRHLLATVRAAHILLYAGVEDVRMLDGDAFNAEFPQATTQLPPPRHHTDFGVTVPARPQLMINMVQAQSLLHRRDASLASIRSWQEHTGQSSGYDYICAKGDIPGARWGHAGTDKDGMQDYLNPDGTLRSEEAITAMWQAQHIRSEQDIAFYCGTGWRASLAFMCARAMGWQRIAVYDGGWYEWSQKNTHGETC